MATQYLLRAWTGQLLCYLGPQRAPLPCPLARDNRSAASKTRCSTRCPVWAYWMDPCWELLFTATALDGTSLQWCARCRNSMCPFRLRWYDKKRRRSLCNYCPHEGTAVQAKCTDRVHRCGSDDSGRWFLTTCSGEHRNTLTPSRACVRSHKRKFRPRFSLSRHPADDGNLCLFSKI